MSNKFSPKLLLECRQGNFKLVNSTIISERLQLDDITAATIIIECCRIFCKKDVPTVEEKYLYELLITCIQFIKKLNDDISLGYLQSVFFILKFFLTQKKFELVLGMKNLLLPKFGNSLKNAKLVKPYSNLCNLIHHAVVDLQHVEPSDENGQVFCQLCILLLEMKSIHLPTKIALANIAYSFFKCSIFLKAHFELQCKCYLDVLQILKTSTETVGNGKSNDFYCAVIKVLDIIIRNLFKQKEFSKIREIVKITTSTAGKVHSKLFDILYHCSQLVVELEDIQDNSKLLKDNFETCLKDMKCFSNNYSLSSEFEKLFNLLYLIYFNLMEYYTSIEPVIWNTVMEEDIQIVICKLLGTTGQIASQIKGGCHFCINCGVKDNVYSALTITALASNLLKISLDKKETISKSVCSYVLRSLESCCIFIKKLSSQKCSQWKSAWTQVGIMIYNIAVKLYALKHNESCNYFQLLIKNVIYLEGIDKSLVFKCDVLGTSFQCLAEMNINTCQYKKALLYAAMGILLTKDPIKAYKMWVSAKAKSKDSGISEECCLQQLTVVCVLEQNKQEIEHLYPELNLQLDAATTRNLLIGELSQYKMMWPSKIPMLTAFKKLYLVADLQTLVKVIIDVWWKNIDSVHNDVIKLLNEVTSKFELEFEQNTKNKESSHKIEKQLYLASLYVMQYYTQTKVARQNIANEINNTIIPGQFPPLPHEESKNVNDECDLVSSHTNLNLDEHQKVIHLLTKALNIFNNCVSNCTSAIIIEQLNQQDMFNVVVKIAHEFRLQCDSVQSIQAWFLCLKISRLLNNNLYLLESISFLIEETNMDSKVISESLMEAESLAKDIIKLNSPEIWAALTTYHINKSTMLLRHQNIQAGFKEYEEASQCFLQVQEDQNELLKIRLDFLHVQYLQLPCDLRIEGHDMFSLVKFSKVLNRITSYVKESGTSSFAVAILFEVYQTIAHMYRWMHLPREVRCYCRDIVTFAQELVIPLQTAYFLIYLAHADLQSTRLDDCQVKLNGLSDILCLDTKRYSPPYNELSEKIVVTNKDVDASNLVEDFAEMMLDYPASDCTYNKSGSPVLFTKSFTMPSFMNHSVDCDCFYCLKVEYKTMILEYINLQAQLHIFQNNVASAHACFSVGLEVYRNIKKDDSFKSKVTKYLTCYPFHDWKDLLRQTVCTLLINYTNSLLRSNDIKKAEVFNKKTLHLLSERKYENLYMYNEALLQKFIIMKKSEDKSENAHNSLQVDAQLFNAKDGIEMPKTPESKQTKLVLITSHSPRPNSPPKRRLRRIKCDFSDNIDSLKTNKSPSSGVSSTKENIDCIKFDLEVENIETSKDPVKIACKTPAPMCLAVNIPATIKISKKKKPLLQEIPLPKYTELSDANANHCGDQNISTVVPISPNAYTPNSLQVSSALHTRTKLLTKRLKKSTVKKGAVNDVDQEGDTSSNCKFAKKPAKNNICKNLMSELCAAEGKVNLKPVRRKKPGNCLSETTKQRTDTTNTRKTTRATSKTK